MIDLVKRLREIYPPATTAQLLHGAADEIERLREERSAARNDALEEAAKVCTQTDSDGCGPDEWGWVASDFARNIRALTRQAQSDALAAARNDVLEKALDEAYYTGATEDVMDAIRALKENSDET